MSQALSESEFNQQVEQLFAQHGIAAFAAPYGSVPPFTLFVEEDTVVAESASSPRHRYGAFCELDDPLTGEALETHVQHWLRSGEAYALYLSMNVCRYNC
ncbi:hypothetical protein A9404_01970 [Halothiobacillus diazotrophicus]|uniref:Uncharacterized protein n=1 Tax=Halothiobacillus diazotrophicus TaxID=1860122 RepID=A0A191ZEL1_9GAMM|nr:hypothetical protein [Halothiobacillus diazotrophicus]ANJ66308.1 hypothetical protein A9404_01970 [Halothiobacillus diazotrophicus]